MAPVIAIIADIVGSREVGSRDETQIFLERTFRDIEPLARMVEPFRATVGDEFQAIAGSLSDAITITMAARLAFRGGAECRFGIGGGDSRAISSEDDRIRDGSAWWRARAAIDTAHDHESAGRQTVRTWVDTGESQDAVVNSYLLVRDHVISKMKSRERAIALGRLQGLTQTELARRHDVSQPAVSKSLERSGAAALLESARLWTIVNDA